MELADVIVLITPFLKYVPCETVIRVNEFDLEVGRHGVKLVDRGEVPKYRIVCKAESLPEGISKGLMDGTIKIYSDTTDVTDKINSMVKVFSF